jgi:DNA-binding response OmpR family regulator
MDTQFPERPHDYSDEADISRVQLGPVLWVDLDGATVKRGREEVLLTAREVHVLRILIQTMRNTRSYIDARALAERIGVKDTMDPGHCVEELISSIRRKLGEVPRNPRILRGRRGLGYRLFPEQNLNQT